ncbi:MAG: hypothetical protein H0Z39_07415 [Peptococcaceae bacterium]|nr:hypothetical protein [Peptococcaceae bacterium]
MALEVIGFYAWRGNWLKLFGAPFPHTDATKGVAGLVSRVAPVWLSVDGQGRTTTQNAYAYRPRGWEKVIGECRVRDIAVDLTVAHLEGNFLEKALADHNWTAKVIEGIIYEAQPYQGVNIDFEGLGNKAKHDDKSLLPIRANFSRFIKMLAARVQVRGQKLYLCLHPLNSWFQGYDYPSLSLTADGLIIMAYHYGPTPEPEDKVEEAIYMALESGVPPGKLVLGILMKCPYETPESFAAKIRLANKYGLHGISIWTLAFFDEEYRKVLASALARL